MSRVYEQSEVDALVAAAEEAGYRACVADVKKENSELDLFLYQGLATYKGVLARHDAEIKEQFSKGCARFHEEGRECATCGREDLIVHDAKIRERVLEEAVQDVECEKVILQAEIAMVRQQCADLETTFELFRQADMRGIKMWRQATGRDMEWPDRGKMIFWLLERLDAQDKERALFEDKEKE